MRSIINMTTQQHADSIRSSSIIEVKDVDVISGRDKLAFTHHGNRFFRSLVICKSHAYQKANFRKHKTQIVGSVIEAIHDAGGRFLSLETNDDGTVGWAVMNWADTYQKVAHALRSSKPMDKRSRTVMVSSASWSCTEASAPKVPRSVSCGEPSRRASDILDEVLVQRIFSSEELGDDHSLVQEDDASDCDNHPCVPCDLSDLLVKEDIRHDMILEEEVMQTLLNEVHDDISSQSTFYTIEGQRAQF